MHHIAIMKKSWGFIEKILIGEKVIESRWYVSKVAPWGKVQKGDIVFFKNSGELIIVKAEVKKVFQFVDLDPNKVREILVEFGKDIGIESENLDAFFELVKNKKYCILIFLKNPQKIEPFQINKKGFGMMSAWLVVEDVEKIQQ